MKTKVNKKYYNFTEKQKRNDVHRPCMHFHTVGKKCKISANKDFRRRNKRILRKIMITGKDRPFIKYCKYMWWDM